MGNRRDGVRRHHPVRQIDGYDPTGAFRFHRIIRLGTDRRTEDVKLVRKEDQYLIDGSTWKSKPKTDAEAEENANQTATEKAAAQKKKNQRHVWVVDGELLKAVEITTGLTENRFTEMSEGELDVSAQLVVGRKE